MASRGYVDQKWDVCLFFVVHGNFGLPINDQNMSDPVNFCWLKQGMVALSKKMPWFRGSILAIHLQTQGCRLSSALTAASHKVSGFGKTGFKKEKS